MDTKDLTLEEFIDCVHEYNPSVIYTINNSKTFYFIGWNNIKLKWIDFNTNFNTKNTFNVLTNDCYIKEDFLKKMNIVLRKEKILKLKSKW